MENNERIEETTNEEIMEEITAMENATGIGENGQGVAESNSETLHEEPLTQGEEGEDYENSFISVSQGDSAIFPQVESTLSEEVISGIQKNNELLEELVTYKDNETMTLWEKPLEEYTVMEGFGLIAVVLIVSVIIYKIIGGIISIWNL